MRNTDDESYLSLCFAQNGDLVIQASGRRTAVPASTDAGELTALTIAGPNEANLGIKVTPAARALGFEQLDDEWPVEMHFGPEGAVAVIHHGDCPLSIHAERGSRGSRDWSTMLVAVEDPRP